jgi:outer membrane protein OmpA-like peptidoglycan-associated protein
MVKWFSILLFCVPGLMAGQTLQFEEARKLSAAVNSEYEESMPLISPDRTTLFFTRFLSPKNKGGQYSGTDVWISRYDVTKVDWSKADNTRLENTPGNNAVIGVSAKGDRVYLQHTVASRDVTGIYFSKKNGNQWSEPELIPLKGIPSEGFLGLYVSPDFDVIFLSMKGVDSRGEEDLYISLKGPAGGWTEPKNLGPTINTRGFEISPYLSADKKRLYFSSNGHPGQGDADIFVSESQYGSWEVWSVPKNLKEVNSPKFDAYFSIYGDSLCFFSSNRGGKMSDIYQSKITVDDGKDDQLKVDSLVNQTKELLEQLRTSTKTLNNLAESKTLVMFDAKASRVQSASEDALELYANYLMKNMKAKLVVEYDGRSMNATAAQQALTQDRLKRIRQILKSYGVAENRIAVSGGLVSTQPLHVRQNSVQFSIAK